MMTPRDMARMMHRVKTASDHTHFVSSTPGGAEDANSIAQRISSGNGGIGAEELRAIGRTKNRQTMSVQRSSIPKGKGNAQQASTPPVSSSGTGTDARYEEPTPADMPKKEEHPLSRLTFAALSSHELPVVREYSAGGLIFNSDGEVAIIARHSRSGHLEWCLPKGHIEKGETPEQTAVREVHEETGIKGRVTGSIATIDYWFTGENQRVHKLVHHFVLRQTSGSLTVKGDPDHEAEDAAWVPFGELTEVLSYPNERRIVHLYSRKYHKYHRRF